MKNKGISNSSVNGLRHLDEGKYQMAGFSLIEILISMSLTGILMILAYQVFQIFLDFQHRYQTEISMAYEVQAVQRQLSLDVNSAWQIEVNGHGYINLLDREGSVRVSYSQNDGLLIRSDMAGKSDTLRGTLIASQAGLFFMDQEQGLRLSFPLPRRASVGHRQAF